MIQKVETKRGIKLYGLVPSYIFPSRDKIKYLGEITYDFSKGEFSFEISDWVWKLPHEIISEIDALLNTLERGD